MLKMKSKKGFTLMEMLIVVAIIAVLVAIAIPTFAGALTKAKEATDVANVRAAYAEWQVAILTEDATLPTDVAGFKAKLGSTLNYDAKLTYDATTNTATYTATKLYTNNDSGTGSHSFTWTLSTFDVQ